MIAPQKEQIRAAILNAMKLLVDNDGTLFGMPIEEYANYDARKLHEVCINHKLAEHLAANLPQLVTGPGTLYVDIEFNREGVNFKDVKIDGQTERVRPDIIAHNRKTGATKFNLLIVECKYHAAPSKDKEFDAKKIKALMSDRRYEYHYGLQVIYSPQDVCGVLFYKRGSTIETETLEPKQPTAGQTPLGFKLCRS